METYSNFERMQRLINGLPIDKVPLFTNASIFSGVFAQLSSQEFFLNMENMYEAQKETRTLFGCHGSPAFCYSNWIAASLGGQNQFKDNDKGISIPQIKPIISSEKEAEEFTLPDKLDSAEFRRKQEFTKIAISRGERKTAVLAGSVVEIAAQVIEPSLLLRWMVRQPELVFGILDLLTEYLLRMIDFEINQYGAANCIALFFYPLESRDIMSPRLLDKFSWPYLSHMHKELKKRGIINFQEHLCGNQNENLSFLKELCLPSRTCFTLDEKTDISKTAAYLGPEYIICGNVSSKLLAYGNKKDIINCCKEILKVGKKLEGGFILAPSCDLPPYTPPLNLYAMSHAIELYGRY